MGRVADYSKEDIVRSLSEVGLSVGDNIFIHSNIGFFGALKDADSREDFYRIFKEAIFEVIGKDGTLVVPTFSYSFCSKKVFNKGETSGVVGVFSEMVRTDPESVRSDDANFSTTALGKNADYFTRNAHEHSFGADSFWERFLHLDGKFCNFNLSCGSLTFIHYIEKLLAVPYRYDKPFPGISIINGQEKEGLFYHFVYNYDKPEHAPNLMRLEQKVKETELAKIANLGKGQIVLVPAKEFLELVRLEVKQDISFLTTGGYVKD